MSGMSMDGLDLALVELRGKGERPEVLLRAAETVPYEADLRARLQAARGPWRESLRPLEREVSRLWGRLSREFLARQGVAPTDVDVLGSHGQTIFHRPREEGHPAESVQIGDAAELARGAGVDVVYDFRQADIAAGGEGAPLVPLADWVLHAGEGVALVTTWGASPT